MLLSHSAISAAIDGGEIHIDPFDPPCLQPSSVDLRLGGDFLEIDPRITVIDPRRPTSHISRHVGAGQALAVEPGDLVLGTTHERVGVGASIAARVEGKSSLARLGLATHVTAGFIDPGFEGRITFEFVNHSRATILLWPGMKIAQICFFRLTDPATVLYGSAEAGSHYQHQDTATASRGWRGFDVIDIE